MYCCSNTLVNSHRVHVTLFPMACRSWGCPDCGPKRAARLAKDIEAGKPNTFITLTVNPSVGADPAERMAMLADAWRRVRRKAKKVWRNGTLAFFAVVERTAQGEPHLHIAARCEWIGQRWLSDQMKALLDAPVCDVSRVRSKKGVAKYISKYLSKDPVKFGTAKRYWKSQDWLSGTDRDKTKADRRAGYWDILREPIADALRRYSWPKWIMVSPSPFTFRRSTDPPETPAWLA